MASETSSNLPPPRLWKKELPKMLLAPPWSASSDHCMSDLSFSFSGPTCWLMSECMSVIRRSARPSLS
jgi:hypothetical protein